MPMPWFREVRRAMMTLVNWLVTNVCEVPNPATGGPAARNAYIRRCAAGEEPAGVPVPLAATITRNAPVAAIDTCPNPFQPSARPAVGTPSDLSMTMRQTLFCLGNRGC